MGASEADRAIAFITNGEDQTIRNTVDHSVCAISRFAVVEPIVSDDGKNVEIDPARERDAVLRKVDGFLGRIEVSHLLYIRFVGASVKPGRGAMRSSPQDRFSSSRYNRAARKWRKP
jgi:hypothetical protein